jgi:hypothetical protein
MGSTDAPVTPGNIQWAYDSDRKIPEIKLNDSAIISKISLTLPNYSIAFEDVVKV